MRYQERSALAETLEQARWAKLEEAAKLEERLTAIDAEQDPELEGRAQDESTATILRRLGDHDQAAIAEIESALARVADGSYGICAECDEEIPVERLRALPTARLCVDCKREQERSRRLRAHEPPASYPMRIIDPVAEMEEDPPA